MSYSSRYYLSRCTAEWRRAKAWRLANPERHRENQRRWREAHPGYAKAWRAARKARHLNLRARPALPANDQKPNNMTSPTPRNAAAAAPEVPTL